MNFQTENLRNIRIQQFHEICRTCLVRGVHKPIFEIIYNEKTLIEILNVCTSLQVEQGDYLPENICSNCVSEIFQMYTFVQKCQDSDAILRDILKSSLNMEKAKEIKDPIVDINGSSDIKNENLSERDIETKENTQSKHSYKDFKCLIAGSSYKCKQCEKSFEEELLLKKHLAVSHLKGDTNHACPVCSKTFTNSKLRQHMRSHTKEKPYKCKICLQGFSMCGNLKRHIMTHTGERPHTCDLCGKGFIQSTTLHKHKKTHLKIEKYVGDINGVHIQCNYCGRAFKRVSRYQNHIKKHELKTKEIIRSAENNSKKTGAYVCSVCGRSCTTKHILKAHERTHGEKLFLCNECGMSFITNAALQSHLRIHTGEKPYKCYICMKSFAHVGSIEAHMLIHTGQKPYQCTVCSRAFTQQTHLKYHARTHSGERPYVCNYCGKSFALNGNLTVHTRTHTGETPYVCSVCGKGFHDSSSLKKHKKVHGENLPSRVFSIQPPPLSHPLIHVERSLDIDHLGMYQNEYEMQ